MDAIGAHIGTLLDQVKWYRYRDGSYSGRDPILETETRLRAMRDGCNGTELTNQDISLLRKSLRDSIRHIDNYNYGEGLDYCAAARIRSETIKPLLAALEALNELSSDREKQC